MLADASATDAELDAAIAINEDARLRALQISLLGLALLSLLAIVPATRMPGAAARANCPRSSNPMTTTRSTRSSIPTDWRRCA